VTDVEQPEDEQRTPETDAPAEEPVAAAEAPAAEAASDAPEPPAEAEAPAEEPAQPVAEEPATQEPAAEEPAAEQPAAEQPAAEQPAAEQPPAAEPAAAPAPSAEEELIEETPRVKPEIPGADLVPDIVPEGGDALGEGLSPYDEDHDSASVGAGEHEDDVPAAQPISGAAISLASGARYTATGKRKTAVARVTLKPGNGEYVINGKSLETFFPRPTLQRNIRQPLETVGYEARMDVVAKLHGGGVSAQAGALRHGISRALLEADPNLRGELKRRGFLTRDARAKERKKAGLKKARKRPQFSKR
jgi:small subunit ribosomal protein S9